MYFSGKIEFGVINQSVSAFNHILGDFSLIVYQFQAISAFSAVINRLGIAFFFCCFSCYILIFLDLMKDMSIYKQTSTLQKRESHFKIVCGFVCI